VEKKNFKNPDIPKKVILAVDTGSKRMGLALWNPKARMARALPVLARKKLALDLAALQKIVSEEGVEAFLVGLPISLGGNKTQSTENAEWWVNKISEIFQKPVYTFDESLSTQEAIGILKMQGHGSSSKKTKEMKDSLSAAVFLEEFIRAQEAQ